MAFAFASLGSRVTMLARGGLLDREEPFVGELVAAALREGGVDVRDGATPTRVERGDEGIVSVELEDGGRLEAEELLVATQAIDSGAATRTLEAWREAAS